MSFNVVFPQIIVEGFPLPISCLDQIENKIFLGLIDGTILEYSFEEIPAFKILLDNVYKKVMKGISAIVILARSRHVAILGTDGSISFCNYASELAKTEPLSRVRGASTLSRCSYAPPALDILAVGLKRGMIILTISSQEAKESPVIKIPSTPTDIQFISLENALVATLSGIFIVNTSRMTCKVLFTLETNHIFQKQKIPYIIAVRKYQPTPGGTQDRLATAEKEVFCSRGTAFYKISIVDETSSLIFHWISAPKTVAVDDYYAIGLIESSIRVKSLKTGSCLQEFQLFSSSIMTFGDLAFIASDKSVWRLVPLDFDEQIDELLENCRFKDAEAFLNELEFENEQEKNMNLIKVKGCLAEHLFLTQKKYQEAISVLEELHASPLDVLDLCPEFLDGRAADMDQNALEEIAGYLARERSQLVRYRQEINEKLSESNTSITSFRSMTLYDKNKSNLEDTSNLLEFVETSLLQAYLVLNSPLLGPLLRVETSCNHTRTIALLIKHEKFEELVEFYQARGYHEKALEFLKINRSNGDYSRIVQYLQQMDMNKDMDIVLKYSHDPLTQDGDLGLKIFTENHRDILSSNRMRIFCFIDVISPLHALKYLEFLVIQNNDTDPEINTRIFGIYLSKARQSPSEKEVFSRFVNTNKYYDSAQALLLIPKNEFLLETAHILSRLHRHTEALVIFVEGIGDFQMAEKYCLAHYQRRRSNGDYLFTILYDLMLKSPKCDDAKRIQFISKYGYKMDGRKALLNIDASMKISCIESFLEKNAQSILSLTYSSAIKNELRRSHKNNARYILMNMVNKGFQIDEDSLCKICLKRLSSTLCALFPDERIAHAYCASRIE